MEKRGAKRTWRKRDEGRRRAELLEGTLKTLEELGGLGNLVDEALQDIFHHHILK